ncbi:DUF4180 domain-containing protein [Ruminococcaceae bacterium OttesenSCG-928-N02]|nr:DUF4180 domain-containing protein [Ruminococcaceae bacterium OttesenSCG-928-N02]
MDKQIIQTNDVSIAIIKSNEALITNAQTALDLMATLDYYDNCQRIALHKSAVAEEFFHLENGLAGEVLQKFVNYEKKVAIIGDFSVYTSKALKAFIYECNRGNHVFFVSCEEEAICKLGAV